MTMEKNVPDFEPILEELGGFGKYQFVQQVFQALGSFVISFPIMIAVFIGHEPPHTCNSVNVTEMKSQYGIADNATVEATYDVCSITLAVNTSGETTTYSLGCVNGHNFSSDFHVSYVSEMGLVCDKAGFGELTQTLLMLGQGIGSFSFSAADRFGRKPVYVITCLGLTVFNVLVAVAPDVRSLIIFRFVTGAFQQGVGLSSFMLFLEMMPPKLRPVGSMIAGTVWSLSIVIFSFLAWALRYHSWRTLQLAVVAFSVYSVLLPWYCEESPRWLACNNKPEKALMILEKWCKRNGKDFNHIKHLFQVNVINRLEKCKDQEKGKATELRVERYTILDLFSHRSILVTTLVMNFVWLTNGLTYFGLALTSSSLAGDRYLNFFLSALAELPSSITAFLMLKRKIDLRIKPTNARSKFIFGGGSGEGLTPFYRKVKQLLICNPKKNTKRRRPPKPQ